MTCNAAPFLISRANEQIKVDVCYNNTNVKLFGLNAGASYGPLASTHHSIDDIAILRGFGNIEIYAPSSPGECRQIIDYALAHVGPVYIRLDGKALPELHDEHYRFIPGNIDVLRLGRDIALVAMGSTVHEIVEAAAQLAAEGIDATVISVPSIRPCDTQALLAAIQSCPAAITVEEHNVNGGVGSLVAEVLAEAGCAIPLRRFGIPDGQYAIAANRAATRARHEIDAAGVVKRRPQAAHKKSMLKNNKNILLERTQCPVFLNNSPWASSLATGIFPSYLVAEAREQAVALFSRLGINTIMLDPSQTELGGVETRQDAKICAELFRTHRDKIHGVVVLLPNFGDEKAIAETLRLSGLNVPVLIQAEEDNLDKWGCRLAAIAFAAKFPFATTCASTVSRLR